MAERVGNGDLATERVVGVSRFVAERIDGLGDAALRVIDRGGGIKSDLDSSYPIQGSPNPGELSRSRGLTQGAAHSP